VMQTFSLDFGTENCDVVASHMQFSQNEFGGVKAPQALETCVF
jgi:hypothetical protein